MQYSDIINKFPKQRKELPVEYKTIYEQYYVENRNGLTKASSLSQKVEGWLHKKVAKTGGSNKKTLEIGAGTLNQLDYECCQVYDIVEPFRSLFENSPSKKKVRNIYNDVSEIPDGEKYDRITSVACFEHICNLPEVVGKVSGLLKEKGVLSVSIPNQGYFLWKLGYTMTTGREFNKRFGLNYDVIMNYEHVNSADEIEIILKHYFKNVRRSFFGIGKNFSLYRYYECSLPDSTALLN